MVMAMIVLSALLVLGMAALRVGLSSKSYNMSANDDYGARLVAEAALHEAVDSLRIGCTGSLGSINQPVAYGGGLFWVDATDLGGTRTQLVATGMLGSGRAALEMIADGPEAEKPLFEAVLNAKDGLTVNADVLTDSFFSSNGSYASQAVNVHGVHRYAETNGDVRSNGDIAINARATVMGDAQPGLGRSITAFGTDAYVDGTMDPLTENFEFPPVEVPPILQSGSYDLASGASDTLPSGRYGFDTFATQRGSTLTIQGPAEILVNSLTWGKDANLVIDARLGPVTFTVLKEYTHTAGFTTSTVGSSPAAVAYFIDSTQDIVFPRGSQVYGGYYAPNADITFSSSSEVWGAIAGNTIDMSNAMAFHYDEDLLGYWSVDSSDGAGAPVELIAWYERSVTPDNLRIDRRDPFQVLGVSRNNALSPADARILDLKQQAAAGSQP